jgi:hypothetical protein
MRVYFSGTSPQIFASTTWGHQLIISVPLLGVLKMMPLVKTMGVLPGVNALYGAEKCPIT